MLPGTDQIREFFGPCICLVGGLFASAVGVFLMRKLSDSKTWPKTTGEVIRSSIKYDYCNQQTFVRPDVAYKYCVKGVEYVSTELAFVEVNTTSAELAESKAERYPRGQLVDVYYNPKKPSDATLSIEDPTHGILPWLLIIVGIIVLVTGAVWTCRVAAHLRLQPGPPVRSGVAVRFSNAV